MANIQTALVRAILEKYKSYEWTVQGFGFIRTKITDVGRIHVWDSRLTVPLVSTVHTHPWPLHSTIISGELINQRFVIDESPEKYLSSLQYIESDIKTGEGGGLTGEPREVRFTDTSLENYIPGDTYSQAPEEIHRTIAQDGTVTLLERPLGPPLEIAKVYWPKGTQWGSAEPKPIAGWELDRTVAFALMRWNG